MSETFGQCLRAWVDQSSLTVKALCERLDIKSRTTVHRLMRDECSTAQCERFLMQLTDAALVGNDWQQRFNQALQTVRMGTQAIAFNDALHSFLLNGEETLPPVGAKIEEVLKQKTQIIALDCTSADIFSLADACLAGHPESSFHHFIIAEQLEQDPRLITALMQRLTNPRYMAFLLPSANLMRADLPWHVFYVFHKNSRAIGYMRHHSFVLHGLTSSAGVGNELRDWLAELNPTPLFIDHDYNDLSEGIDTLRSLQRVERNEDIIALHATPYVGLVPTAINLSAIRSGILAKTDGNGTYESIADLLRRRFENFAGKKATTTLLICQQSMLAFAKHGLLTDHLECMRPYTPNERQEILDTLLTLAAGDAFHIYYVANEICARYSIDSHKRSGLSITASYTIPGEPGRRKRTLILPRADFAANFESYVAQLIDLGLVMTQEETLQRLRQLRDSFRD